MNIDIKFFDSVDSTNKRLREMAQSGCENGTVIVAWSQTEGRGRLGRSFCSPHGGIYMSILLPYDETMMLTAKAAVAVKRAIYEITGKKCRIKWVNDILLDGKKVCGILAEACEKQVVLGIGINFSTRSADFPDEIKNIAGSLYPNPSKQETDELDLIHSIVDNLVKLCENRDDSWLYDYKASDCLVGKEVKIIQANKVTGDGIVTEIDNNCALHIMKNGKETVLTTGEVSIREK